MPSILHESILALLQDHPALLRDLAPLAGLSREFLRGQLRLGATGLQTLLPPERQADLVLLVERETRPQLVMAVEVQGAIDGEKALVWPFMTAALRMKHRCDAVVLVVALQPDVERWAATGFALSPVQHMRPLVVGPGRVPAVRDPEEAQRAPHRALLAAMVHLRGPEAAEVGEVALLGLIGVDPAERSRYEDIVLHLLGPLARPVMEKLMRSHYEFRSELALERYAQGREEGREEGRVEGRVEGRKEGEGEGRRAFAAEMLRLRFGAAADPMLPLLAEADGETLRWLAQRLLDPISPEALLEGLVACVRGTPAR
jgi:hypothetical protein